jgi:hypothetical protein
MSSTAPLHSQNEQTPLLYCPLAAHRRICHGLRFSQRCRIRNTENTEKRILTRQSIIRNVSARHRRRLNACLRNATMPANATLAARLTRHDHHNRQSPRRSGLVPKEDLGRAWVSRQMQGERRHFCWRLKGGMCLDPRGRLKTCKKWNGGGHRLTFRCLLIVSSL